jgi:hypothetical protein
MRRVAPPFLPSPTHGTGAREIFCFEQAAERVTAEVALVEYNANVREVVCFEQRRSGYASDVVRGCRNIPH